MFVPKMEIQCTEILVNVNDIISCLPHITIKKGTTTRHCTHEDVFIMEFYLSSGRKFSNTHNSESVEAPPLPAKESCRPSGWTVRLNMPQLLCSPAFSGLPPSTGTRHRSQTLITDESGAENRIYLPSGDHA